MKNILNKYLITSLLIALSTSACAKHNGIETGKGSWYGKKFHGRKTASGEKYNMYALTAAHKTLPFNTMVEVTNLSNNRKVTVRINDRGPYAKGRIIDLSYLGAKKLGYLNKGVAKLKVRVLSKKNKK